MTPPGINPAGNLSWKKILLAMTPHGNNPAGNERFWGKSCGK